MAKRSAPLAAPCLALAAALAAPIARAQSAPPPPPPPNISSRTGAFVFDKNQLRVSFSYRDVVDADITNKLSSGIPTVIVMKAWLFESGQSTPVPGLLTAKSCRVTFDVWEEVFKVVVTQPGSRRTEIVPNLAGVLRRCAEVDRVFLAERSQLKVNVPYVVQSIVEVNPMSAETIAQIRRWVTRPNGSSTVGANNALFSSFVGLFVAQIGNADKTLRFKTQDFAVPPPPPPPKK